MGRLGRMHRLGRTVGSARTCRVWVQHAGIDDREAYGTFNMGAGFALYLPQAQAEQAVAISKAQGIDAWVAGRVEAGPKRVVIEPLNLEYSADDLHLRA